MQCSALCSRCGVNPPRYPVRRTMGRVPICAMCLRERNQAKYLRRVSRATGRPVPVMADPGYGEADISDAEIERRYQAALSQIRRRA